MGNLTNIIEAGIQKALRKKEDFHHEKDGTRSLSTELVKFIVFFVLIVIIAFIGKLLWNSFLAGSGKDAEGFFTFIKPLPTLWHAIAVYVTIGLFFGSC